MLILVAVTITMAVNGGLFEQAGRAGTQTNTARDAEQEFANVQPGMTYDDLINKYTEWEEEGDGSGNQSGTTTCIRCKDSNGKVTGYQCTVCGSVADAYESGYENWQDGENPGDMQYWCLGCLHILSEKPVWGTYTCLHNYPKNR